MDGASTQPLVPVMMEFLPSGTLWLVRLLLGMPALVVALLLLQVWRHEREDRSLPFWIGAGLVQFLMTALLAASGTGQPAAMIAIVVSGNLATVMLIAAGARRLAHAEAGVGIHLFAAVAAPVLTLVLVGAGAMMATLLLNFVVGSGTCALAAWQSRRVHPGAGLLAALLGLRALVFALGPVLTLRAPQLQAWLFVAGVLVFAAVLIAALNCVLRRRQAAEQESRAALFSTEALLRVAHDIGAMAAGGQPLPELARSVVTKLQEVIAPLAVTLHDYDAARREFVLQAISAGPPELQRFAARVPVAQSANIRRVAEGETLLLTDFQHDPDAQPASLALARAVGIEQQVMIPIRGSAGVSGALTLVFAHRERLPDSWIQAALLVASSVGQALQIRQQFDELRERARRDTLTALLNREGLHEAFERRVVHTAVPGPALLLIDLDRFKEVNDAFGHRTGDRLIRAAGERLRELAESLDASCARLGGDEFALLVPALDASGALALGERLQALLRSPFDIDALRISVGASIGIATAGDARIGSHEMLRRADVAMYHAKSQGIACSVYAPGMDPDARERLELASAVHAALDGEQLHLFYQPKVRLADGAVVGVEALIRWLHPDRGWIPPGQFIPMLELGPLINRISLWVAGAALAQAREWRTRGIALPIAINISPRNLLSPAWCAAFLEAVREAGLPPAALEIEITENSLMSSAEQARARLEEIAAASVTIAIDDFGTGYSSLSYLQKLAIDTVKIDRSFVTGIVERPQDAKIAALIVSLAKSLERKVVAEGVENAATHELLRELGCEIGQGYHYARPLPAAEFEAWLRAREAVPV